jgi:hypothetical protein
VARKVDWPGLGTVLARVDPRYLFLGWILSLPVYLGLALRWQIFLRQQAIRLPFRTVFSLTWAGQFFNSLLPGSSGGDVVKIYQLCRREPQRKAMAAATVIADRLVALFALVVLAAGGLVMQPAPLRLLAAADWPVKTLLIVGGILALGLVVALKVARPTAAFAQLGRLLAACRDALRFNSWLSLAIAMGFAVHLLNFVVIYFFARALGIPITYVQVVVMMSVILFLVLMPVTINGHGLRELLLIAYFGYLSIAVPVGTAGVKEVAVALSLLMVANDLLWSLPGGLWYFLTVRNAPPHLASGTQTAEA